jgi:hypothetical protein
VNNTYVHVYKWCHVSQLPFWSPFITYATSKRGYGATSPHSFENTACTLTPFSRKKLAAAVTSSLSKLLQLKLVWARGPAVEAPPVEVGLGTRAVQQQLQRIMQACPKLCIIRLEAAHMPLLAKQFDMDLTLDRGERGSMCIPCKL